MEADWEVEIGPDAPVIDACWSGFVDLRLDPAAASQLPETPDLPALASALEAVNASSGSLYTVKCDVWCVEAIDWLEWDATAEESAHGLACYIDLVPRDPQRWRDPKLAVAWCKELCAVLRSFSLRRSRIDLVVRAANLVGRESLAVGVTSYLAACGSTREGAKSQLTFALKAFIDAVQSIGVGPKEPVKLQ